MHDAMRGVPEQELAVQVGDVDGVHVDHVDAAAPGQRQVLEQLAAQAAGTDAQHPAVVLRGSTAWLSRYISSQPSAARQAGVACTLAVNMLQAGRSHRLQKGFLYCV